MTEVEEKCWRYINAHRDSTAMDIALHCRVPVEYAQSLIDRISSPNWRESVIDKQVGGSHYKDMAIQPWQAMEAWLTPEEYRGYHKGVAIGYLAREQQKAGIEDIKKAIHHLQRLVEMQDDTKASE